MERKKFESLSELKEFIDFEGEESDILEYKDYRRDRDVDEHKDDIINCIVGFANKGGGYFIIGVDKNKNVVYTKINDPLFKEKVEGWIDSYVDPRGLLLIDIPKPISDNNGQCMIIYINTRPGICFARRREGREKRVTSYFFPYRTGGSTKTFNFEEFFKIYIQKFLESLAVSSELVKKEEEKLPPVSPIGGVSEEGEPINSKLVNKYVDMLRNEKFPAGSVNRLLQSIRNEAYKVYNKREINKEDLPAIKNLVDFACEFVKDKNEEIAKEIFGILYLLTRAHETLHIVKETCYDYLKGLYESGKRYEDLVKILDECGHFGDRIDEIMKAIENKDQKLLDILTSRIDFTAVKERNFELIWELLLKKDTLVLERDRRIIDKIEHLIGQLERL